jgi:YHS domain-containing protein
MIFIWRLLVVLLLLTVLRWAVAWIFGSGPRKVRTSGQRQVPKSSKRMVKDPQCGMYLAPELAIEMRNAGGNLYFCSKECQENYAKAQLKG